MTEPGKGSSVKLIVILLIAFALRVPALYLQSMTGDEASTVFQADFPLEIMIERLSTTEIADADIAPPFYFVLLNALVRSAPFSVERSRLMSLLFDLATILATFVLVGRFVDRTTALAASFLIALSPFHVWYAAEIRMYAIVPLFAVISTMAMIEIDRNGRWHWYFLYWLGASLGIYTQYYSGLLIAAQGIVGLFLFRGRRQAAFLGSLAAVGIVFLPWLPSFLIDLKVLGTHSGEAGGGSLLALPYVLIKLFLFGNRAFITTYLPFYGMGILILSVAALMVFRSRRDLGRPTGIVAAVLLTAVLLLVLSGIASPQSLRPHATIVLLPLALTVLARATVVSGRGGIAIRTALVIFWGFMLIMYNNNPLFGKPRVREACATLCLLAGNGEPVFNLPLAIPVPDDVSPGSFQVIERNLVCIDRLYFLRGETAEELVTNLRSNLRTSRVFYLLRYIYQIPPDHYRDFDQLLAEEGFTMTPLLSFPSKVDGFALRIERWHRDLSPDIPIPEREPFVAALLPATGQDGTVRAMGEK